MAIVSIDVKCKILFTKYSFLCFIVVASPGIRVCGTNYAHTRSRFRSSQRKIHLRNKSIHVKLRRIRGARVRGLLRPLCFDYRPNCRTGAPWSYLESETITRGVPSPRMSVVHWPLCFEIPAEPFLQHQMRL